MTSQIVELRPHYTKINDPKLDKLFSVVDASEKPVHPIEKSEKNPIPDPIPFSDHLTDDENEENEQIQQEEIISKLYFEQLKDGIVEPLDRITDDTEEPPISTSPEDGICYFDLHYESSFEDDDCWDSSESSYHSDTEDEEQEDDRTGKADEFYDDNFPDFGGRKRVWAYY
jgi:hypothetical protein